MSFGNYRDWQRDWANRNAANVAQNNWQHAQHAFAGEANRIVRDYNKFNVGGSRSIPLSMMIAQHTAPYQSEMGRHDMAMQQAANAAMANESAWLTDRIQDRFDNQVAGQRHANEMAHAAKMAEIGANERTDKHLANQIGNINFGNLGEIKPDVPKVDLYNNGGKRIGGSYFKKSLLG
jgi:hypothetical protein